MVQEVVKARNIRIVILTQIAAFPNTCVAQFLNALKSEQWGG